MFINVTRSVELFFAPNSTIGTNILLAQNFATLTALSLAPREVMRYT